MSTMPVAIQQAHAWCEKTDGEQWPYSYGGGHPIAGVPSVGSNGLKGYDCSGAACGALHAGGLVGREALGTTELASWRHPGEGEWLTLFDINIPTLHHCVLWFPKSELHKQLFQAAEENTIVGWVPAAEVAGLLRWLHAAGFEARCPGITT